MDVNVFFLVLLVLASPTIGSKIPGQDVLNKIVVALDKGIENSPLDAPVKAVAGAFGTVEDPDIERNVIELIESNGYPCENHVVQTRDGYILTMQRIPHGLKNAGNRKRARKEVVLFAHGLLASADSYLLLSPSQSLGYITADAGYDVWLGNFRGGPYAKWNVNCTLREEQFYDFCLDQLAAFDMPAMIDYVLKITGRKKLFLIGESLGSAVAFATLSSIPKYNKKVELFIALSPVAYVSNMLYTTRILCLLMAEFDKLTPPRNLAPRSAFGDLLKQAVCNSVLQYFTCEKDFALLGSRPFYLNSSRMGVIVNHFPVETSTRLIAHFGQLIKSNKFCKFDYGEEENLRKYKQAKPPSYDLGAITTRVGLISAASDALAAPADVSRITKELVRCPKESFIVPDQFFNHLDFAAGYRACQLVFPEVLGMLERAVQRRKRRA